MTHWWEQHSESPWYSQPLDISKLQEIDWHVCTLRERQVLYLRYFQGYTTPETAKAMGITQGSVKKYRKSAISKLKSSLLPTA